MLESTSQKLEDARVEIERLDAAQDGRSYREAFAAFVNHSRAVTNAMQKELRHKADGFDDWYGTKEVEMRADPLLKYFHNLRVEDFHREGNRLQFSTSFDFGAGRRLGPVPAPEAMLMSHDDGFYWVIDQGTPKERRIPLKAPQLFQTQAYLVDAPTTHKDKPVGTRSPRSLCKLVLEYMESLVFEAKKRFAETGN